MTRGFSPLNNIERGLVGSRFIAADLVTIPAGRTGQVSAISVQKSGGLQTNIFAVVNYYGGGNVNFRSYLECVSGGAVTTVLPLEYGFGTTETVPFISRFAAAQAGGGQAQAPNSLTVLFDNLSDLQLTLQPTAVTGIFDEIRLVVKTNVQSAEGLFVFYAVQSD